MLGGELPGLVNVMLFSIISELPMGSETADSFGFLWYTRSESLSLTSRVARQQFL